MTGPAVSPMPELLVAVALAGFMSGLLYFAVLRRTAMLFASRSGWLLPAALTAVRIGAAAGLLALAAKLGAAPLLAAFAGFLLARTVALRIGGRAT